MGEMKRKPHAQRASGVHDHFEEALSAFERACSAMNEAEATCPSFVELQHHIDVFTRARNALKDYWRSKVAFWLGAVEQAGKENAALDAKLNKALRDADRWKEGEEYWRGEAKRLQRAADGLVCGDYDPAWPEVVNERRRQVQEEGWSFEHDDRHVNGEMAMAAACYALMDTPRSLETYWPWPKYLKRKDQRSNLIRAGALILAEIERLDRAAGKVVTE